MVGYQNDVKIYKFIATKKIDLKINLKNFNLIQCNGWKKKMQNESINDEKIVTNKKFFEIEPKQQTNKTKKQSSLSNSRYKIIMMVSVK